MFDWFGQAWKTQTEYRLTLVESWISNHNGRINKMSAELDALKAAVAADEAMDAKFVAAVEAMVAKVADLQSQLSALAAQEVIAPADVGALANELQAHVADMAAHLPADTTGAA